MSNIVMNEHCPKCGKRHNESDKFCSSCGFSLFSREENKENLGNTSVAYENEMSNFIGYNADIYIVKFERLRSNETTSSWNWASFFNVAYWCFYRKMYGLGVIVLGINFLSIFLGALGSFVSLGIAITMGVQGNYLYMKYVDKQISAASCMDENQKKQHFLKKGGTNVGASIAVLVGVFIIVYIIWSIRGY